MKYAISKGDVTLIQSELSSIKSNLSTTQTQVDGIRTLDVTNMKDSLGLIRNAFINVNGKLDQLQTDINKIKQKLNIP